MRQVTRKGLMTMAAATGVLAAAGGAAHADSGAHGAASGSPGVLSGNTVQAPVHIPVNVCGNTVNVVGLLNPVAGNACVNEGGGASGGYGDDGGYGGSGGSGGHGGSGGAHADGHATDSPGVGSGNHVQAPIQVPVNVCGNSVDVVGLGNATEGNDCVNEDGSHGNPPSSGPKTPPKQPENPGAPENPATPEKPDGPDDPSRGNEPEVQFVTQPKGTAQLAQTGSDLPLGLALPVGAGALLAGVVLYRKARASA
ncbi:chaplin family protein [Streptomyces sp. NPDC052020]|uniref:chaplin n=1 Tax=Streptomyces sp. NPDC052020 TaxID=3155677 RepID=UPI00343B4BA5